MTVKKARSVKLYHHYGGQEVYTLLSNAQVWIETGHPKAAVAILDRLCRCMNKAFYRRAGIILDPLHDQERQK